MMTQRKLREQEVQIARYRVLEREVTDPLAASLLHIIVSELEADLRRIGKHPREYPSAEPSQSRPGKSRPLSYYEEAALLESGDGDDDGV